MAIKAERGSNRLDWNPNGEILAVGYRIPRTGVTKNYVRLFSTRNAQEIATTTEIVGAHVDIAWSPDGSRLAAACLNSCVRIWDTALNELHQVFSDGVSCLSWSPDGEYLAIGDSLNRKCTLAIYETSDWKLLRNFSLNTGVVAALAWHPHLPCIASAHRDGTVRIWDHLTGRELCSFQTHKGSINGVTWTRDGMRLASCGDDGNVRIWDASAADVYLKRHGELRDQATNYVRQQNYLDAIKTLDRLQQLHPQERELGESSQNIRWLMAMQLAVDGKLDDATAIFKQLDDEAANLPDYRLRLPGGLFAAEKCDAALALAESIAAEFPGKREYRDELVFLYESRATQLCRAGQFAEAETILRKLAADFPERVDNRAELVFEMARTGNVQETIAMLERLAQSFETWADYRPTLARRLAAAGAHEMAATVYEQLVAGYPDAPEYQTLHETELAHVLESAGQLNEAIDLLRSSEQKYPSLTTRQLLAQMQMARGLNSLNMSESDQAIADLSEAFGQLDDQSQSTAGYYLALTQLAASKFDDYRTTCAQMIEQFGGWKKPQDANWLAWSCALAPAATSDYSIPIAAAEIAVRSDRQSVQFLTALGAILYRAGQYDMAMNYLTQASDLGARARLSSPAYTNYFLTLTCHALNRADEAQQWQTQADALALAELAQESLPWNRKLTLQILRAEAGELLEGSDELNTSPESPPKPDGS